MIVVVGADNTGKTTLVQKLKESFKLYEIPRYHTLPPTDYADWFRWVKSVLSGRRVDTIVDRFFIDEFVYGPIKRGKIGLEGQKLLELEVMFSEERPLIILCDTAQENIEKTFFERDQYPDLSEIAAIREKFKEVLLEPWLAQCPVITFDYTKDKNFRNVQGLVKLYLKSRYWRER